MPHLARRVAGAERIAPVQAMGPLAYRVRPPAEGGVLLVGDAAGFYDPFTGEGVFSALRAAEMAAETVTQAFAATDWSAATLSAYTRARRAAFSASGPRKSHLFSGETSHTATSSRAASYSSRTLPKLSAHIHPPSATCEPPAATMTSWNAVFSASSSPDICSPPVHGPCGVAGRIESRP